MPTYVYQALKSDGSRTGGELEARTRSEAFAQLARQKLQPVSVSAKAPGGGDAAAAAPGPVEARKEAAGPAPGSIRLSRAQVIFFTEEMSDLLEAGLQLEGALRVVEERQETSSLRGAAAALRQLVRDGVAFSEALKRVSPSFGDLYCSLVAAGEASGALAQILRRQVRYLNVMSDLRSRIAQAMIYPAFIAGAGVLLMALFMGILVPQLTSLFENSRQKMPLPTRMLIGASDFVVGQWWLILILVAAAWGGAVIFVRTPAGREWFDRFKLAVPVFGPVLRCAFFAQFCQTLGNLVANGLPLLNGLKLVHRTTGNTYLRGRMDRILDMVAEGGALSRAMKKSGGFPEMLIDLVAVGEQTGDLGTSLERAAGRYEKEMNRRIERLTALIQPVVIVCIAILVGAVVYSIITSIFEAISSIRSRG